MALMRTLQLMYPLAGLHRSMSYQGQPPWTSARQLNVRPVAGTELRRGGGSRPGLVKRYQEELGQGDPIRLLAQVTARGAPGLRCWDDYFDGTALSSLWTTAGWVGYRPAVMGLDGPIGVRDGAVGAVRDLLNIDAGQPYSVKLYVLPWEGAFHGKYRIYARMNETSPDATDNGVVAELVMTGKGGEYTGALKSCHSGTPTSYAFTGGDDNNVEPGWFQVLVDGNTVSVFWKNHLLVSQELSAHNSTRLGFGFDCTVPGGACCADMIRVLYYDGSEHETTRRFLVASAAGAVYIDDDMGAMTPIATELTLADDVRLLAAERTGLLYVADYSDTPKAAGAGGEIDESGLELSDEAVSDWTALGIDPDDDVVVLSNVQGAVEEQTFEIASVASDAVTLAASAGGSGTCSYRIARGPKIVDPSAETVTLWRAAAEKGQTPNDCPIVCRYRDRMVLAGGGVWYMSRAADPLDWDYGADTADPLRAVSGANAEAGQVPAPITAVAPWLDDYLVFGCRSSLWVMRGDPVYGGLIHNLSHNVGIIDRAAWCWGPSGELLFLSADGIYRLPPGAEGNPEPVSRTRLPDELRDINTDLYEVTLVYDVAEHGVHVFVTPKG